MSSYIKKAVNGIGTTLMFSFLAALIAYAIRVYLANYFTTEEFGILYSVLNLVIICLFIRDLGLGESLIKHIAEYKVHEKFGQIKSAIISVVSLKIIGSLVLGIILFFSSSFLAQKYFKESSSIILLYILILYIFFSIFFIILKEILLGLQEMALFSSVDLVKNVLLLLLIIIFVNGGAGIFGPALAYLLVCPILFFIYLPATLRRFPFLRIKTAKFKETSFKVASFGIPLFATALGSKIIGYIDTLILTYFRTPFEVGVYNAILPTALTILYLGTAVATPMFPLASELWSRNQKEKLAQGMELIHRYMFTAIVPLVIIPFVFAKPILTTLFREEFSSGIVPFQILMVGVFFCTLGVINTKVLSGIGKPKIVTGIIFLSAAANVVINILLIPSLGMIGAAIATTISYFLIFLLSTYKINANTGMAVPWKTWLRLTIPALMLFALLEMINLLITNTAFIIIGIAISGGVYFLCLCLLQIINIKELKYHYRIIKNKKNKRKDEE